MLAHPLEAPESKGWFFAAPEGASGPGLTTSLWRPLAKLGALGLPTSFWWASLIVENVPGREVLPPFPQELLICSSPRRPWEARGRLRGLCRAIPPPWLPYCHVGHECPLDSWSMEASAQC